MKKVPGKALLDWLSEIAPLGDLAKLLHPPDTLYQLENAFSTDKDRSASSLSGHFFSGLPFPKEIPAYSVAISMKGDTRYLTLIDKKRKIIVIAPIRASEGEWENAIISIRSALREKGGNLTISTEEGVGPL